MWLEKKKKSAELSKGKKENKYLSWHFYAEKLANHFRRSAEQSKWEGAEVSYSYVIVIQSGKQQPKRMLSRSRIAAKEQWQFWQ